MKVTIQEGSGFFNLYGVFADRAQPDMEGIIIGPGRYPSEAKVLLRDGRKVLVQRRFLIES